MFGGMSPGLKSTRPHVHPRHDYAVASCVVAIACPATRIRRLSRVQRVLVLLRRLNSQSRRIDFQVWVDDSEPNAVLISVLASSSFPSGFITLSSACASSELASAVTYRSVQCVRVLLYYDLRYCTQYVPGTHRYVGMYVCVVQYSVLLGTTIVPR